MRGGGYKCSVLKMHLKLRDQPLNILLYRNLMVTTNQKSVMYIHKKTKKESKHNTENSHQITREENKRRKGGKRPTKTINKMAIRTYILIITLNVSRVNAPTKDIEWLHGYNNKTHIYGVCKRLTSDLEIHTD